MTYKMNQVYKLSDNRTVTITTISKDFIKYDDTFITIKNFEQYHRPKLIGHMKVYLGFIKIFKKL